MQKKQHAFTKNLKKPAVANGDLGANFSEDVIIVDPGATQNSTANKGSKVDLAIENLGFVSRDSPLHCKLHLLRSWMLPGSSVLLLMEEVIAPIDLDDI